MHLHFIKTLETPTGCNPPLEDLHPYNRSPLGAYTPRIYKRTHQTFGAIALPLGESGRTIATVVAHREPWGVKKLTATTLLRLCKKLKWKNSKDGDLLILTFHCFVAFLNQNEILISKTTRPRDCFASLPIPLFAKNSRLGYFLNVKSPHPAGRGDDGDDFFKK
jgi:hypothetical protein